METELFCGMIPHDVLHLQTITQTAKLLYGIIYGFNFNGRECFATNEKLGAALGVKEDAIIRAIGSLAALNLIVKTYEDGQRRLTIFNGVAKTLGGSENARGGSQKSDSGGSENATHNNNIIYNNNINKKITSEKILLSKDDDFTNKHFIALDENIVTDLRYMNVGRRPLKKYPNIWITSKELQAILDRCKECTVNPKQLFDYVQSWVLQKVSEGQSLERLNVANALSGWAFEKVLSQVVLEIKKEKYEGK